MSRLDNTLVHLAPGVGSCRDLEGRYNPRRGLAIYYLPVPDYVPSSPGLVLGEALAARSGLGCVLLEGVPHKIPEGAALIARYGDLKAVRPDLLENVPELTEPGQYAIKLDRSALVVSPSPEGLSSGMQTLAMLVLRYNEEPVIPGCVIVDAPFCRSRCLAVELHPGEITLALLMQIASFAATFKANRLHIILPEKFHPGRNIPGADTFAQACRSFGMEIGVRMPLLRQALADGKGLAATWKTLRAAARVFGATQIALDDPCPEDADPAMARRIAQSAIDGDAAARRVFLDAALLAKSGCPPQAMRAAGVRGWHRIRTGEEAGQPPSGPDGVPFVVDVEAPVSGFTSRTMDRLFHALDRAAEWLRPHQGRGMCVSFRNIGVSHIWQNLLYPSATGLIAAWGAPMPAEEAGLRFSNLLYGDLGRPVMDMWEAIARAFPSGLSAGDEQLVRRAAFGEWPESDAARATLSGIDWPTATRNIRVAADALKSIASGLQRNAGTLTGARLSLYALSWLHCFVALVPELERRRLAGDGGDGRTGPIAAELLANFRSWETQVRGLSAESGLEFVETRQIEMLGARLKELCEGIAG
ncbi:MAG: hypothetical protein LBS30_06560 [Planctomycetota bacterium]|jgi:hypothetical protein|nr:hypothetical protein [Planctomycetota bacterium]